MSQSPYVSLSEIRIRSTLNNFYVLFFFLSFFSLFFFFCFVFFENLEREYREFLK